MDGFTNKIICGDAVKTLRKLPDESVHLAITSPPYWNLADYGSKDQIGRSDYDKYIDDLLKVWVEIERILIPNGKLCINTPMVPVPKKVYNKSHTRQLKNINNDIEYSIIHGGGCSLERYSLFIWQKQTSVKMFGSYPYPPNIYEDNTIEFINVYVKPGKPRKLGKNIKAASKLTQEEWLNLTMQIWPMYPEDVRRSGGHPAPFPVVLPQRLIMMYSLKAAPRCDFPGDVVLDPFAGAGATCVAAKLTGRRFIGIDLNPEYCRFARRRIKSCKEESVRIMLPKVKVGRPFSPSNPSI